MKRALPLLAAAGFLALWFALSTRYPPALLPGPIEVLQACADPKLATALWTTTRSALAGLAIASVVALGGAVAFQKSQWLELALYPYALLLQTVPIIAIAPLLVVWLGYGSAVAVASAAIVCFFPLLTAGNVGLRDVSASQVELMRLYGASWGQELVKLRLPAALPHVFAGYRNAVGLSVIGAIVGEFVASNGMPVSLGYLVLSTARSAQTDRTFSAILASTVLALSLFGAVRLAERTMLRWREET